MNSPANPLAPLLRRLGGRRRRPAFRPLRAGRRPEAAARITVIGGGTGLPSLIRGIKRYSHNISAIVTMADDGGSSGRLRRELGIPPPGDIRNCLVALADSEDVMERLMDYRFTSDGQLNGHSFGNMLIAALADIGGDFSRAVAIAGELLAIRGRVIPSTTTDVTLLASTETGETLTGETSIAAAPSPLRTLALSPPNPPAHPEAAAALAQADLIIIGPGSLYTSIAPNLLIPGIAQGVAQSPALKVYVCNVAEEPRQTEGYAVQDHLEIVRRYAGPAAVDAVIANGRIPAGPTPAGLNFISLRRPWRDSAQLIEADVIDETATARHDPAKLARVLSNAYHRRPPHRRPAPSARAANPELESQASYGD